MISMWSAIFHYKNYLQCGRGSLFSACGLLFLQYYISLTDVLISPNIYSRKKICNESKYHLEHNYFFVKYYGMQNALYVNHRQMKSEPGQLAFNNYASDSSTSSINKNACIYRNVKHSSVIIKYLRLNSSFHKKKVRNSKILVPKSPIVRKVYLSDSRES